MKNAAKTTAKLAANLEKLRNILLLVRATGGYKYRSLIRGSDMDVREATQQGYADLTELVVGYTVAMEMLGELPPSGHHARLEEFQGRRAEAYELLASKAKTEGNIVPFRQPEPQPEQEAPPA